MTRSRERERSPALSAAIPQVVRAALGRLPAARDVSVEPGWGAGNVVAKVAGKIFLLFAKGELVLKLPRPRVEELVSVGAGRRFDPRKDGRLMKEWIVLRSYRSRATGDLVREAHQFTSGSRGGRAQRDT